MRKIHKLVFILAASAAVASCAAADDAAREPSTEQASTSEAAINPVATGPVRAGYVHALERSKFSIGGKAVSRAELGMQKSVGDQGVFATLPTGLTLGMPNADATARQKAPYSGGADAHEGRRDDTARGRPHHARRVTDGRGRAGDLDHARAVKTENRMSASVV